MTTSTAKREAQLVEGIARAHEQLDQALHSLELDNVLARYAGTEIPDAVARLDHVVRMTEQAAHQTLDLVESARRIVNDWLGREANPAQRAPAEALARLLSEMALAQGYQDLTGQIIRRVVDMVRGVESALGDLLKLAGRNPEVATEESWDGRAQGPSVLKKEAAVSQTDADDLLKGLGL